MKWLIFGHKGWIGKKIIHLLEQQQTNETILTSGVFIAVIFKSSITFAIITIFILRAT